MADYPNTRTDAGTAKRNNMGMTIGIVLVAVIVIVGLLFATGFWSAKVTDTGALPEVSVKGGDLPNVDVHSKELVVGTSKTKVTVPKVETTTTTVDVPTVGVKDDRK
ncbi:MAG: hypothetical protein B7Y45_12085 [Sphingomonas sp. 28-66-16]|nr:MAG: hypothetical protein B7Y45_12085 [Sphingomonas sp. 28-66-16]